MDPWIVGLSDVGASLEQPAGQAPKLSTQLGGARRAAQRPNARRAQAGRSCPVPRFAFVRVETRPANRVLISLLPVFPKLLARPCDRSPRPRTRRSIQNVSILATPSWIPFRRPPQHAELSAWSAASLALPRARPALLLASYRAGARIPAHRARARRPRLLRIADTTDVRLRASPARAPRSSKQTAPEPRAGRCDSARRSDGAESCSASSAGAASGQPPTGEGTAPKPREGSSARVTFREQLISGTTKPSTRERRDGSV
jgi:hypothetical protein